MGGPRLTGTLEAGPPATNRQRGLEENDVVQREPRAQARSVVGTGGTKVVLAQPEPDEGVVVEENYNGSQPNSFEACGEEHSEIEAGTQPVFQYLTGRSDFLAVTLKGGRRIYVADIKRADCPPECFGLRPGTLLITGLIPFQAIRLARGTQLVGRRAEDACNGRIIWFDKGGEGGIRTHVTLASNSVFDSANPLICPLNDLRRHAPPQIRLTM